MAARRRGTEKSSDSHPLALLWLLVRDLCVHRLHWVVEQSWFVAVPPTVDPSLSQFQSLLLGNLNKFSELCEISLQAPGFQLLLSSDTTPEEVLVS